MLAFAVFSLVSVGSMIVMGQGTNASQRALEITLVRQQLDAQAEALRAAQQAFTVAPPGTSTTWSAIATGRTIDDSTHFTMQDRCPAGVSDVNNSFIMDPRDGSAITTGGWLGNINESVDDKSPPPYAQLVIDPSKSASDDSAVKPYGIWIEREYLDNGGGIGSYNFIIRACWYSVGLDAPMQLETVVRLYAPAS